MKADFFSPPFFKKNSTKEFVYFFSTVFPKTADFFFFGGEKKVEFFSAVHTCTIVYMDTKKNYFCIPIQFHILFLATPSLSYRALCDNISATGSPIHRARYGHSCRFCQFATRRHNCVIRHQNLCC